MTYVKQSKTKNCNLYLRKENTHKIDLISYAISNKIFVIQTPIIVKLDPNRSRIKVINSNSSSKPIVSLVLSDYKEIHLLIIKEMSIIQLILIFSNFGKIILTFLILAE